MESSQRPARRGFEGRSGAIYTLVSISPQTSRYPPHRHRADAPGSPSGLVGGMAAGHVRGTPVRICTGVGGSGMPLRDHTSRLQAHWLAEHMLMPRRAFDVCTGEFPGYLQRDQHTAERDSDALAGSEGADGANWRTETCGNWTRSSRTHMPG